MKITYPSDPQALLQLKNETVQMLQDTQWKLAKTERALNRFEMQEQDCLQRIAKDTQRLEENRQVLQIISLHHPMRKSCEGDLYRTDIRLEKLRRRLKNFSSLKKVKLELKKKIWQALISHYQSMLLEISQMMQPKKTKTGISTLIKERNPFRRKNLQHRRSNPKKDPVEAMESLAQMKFTKVYEL